MPLTFVRAGLTTLAALGLTLAGTTAHATITLTAFNFNTPATFQNSTGGVLSSTLVFTPATNATTTTFTTTSGGTTVNALPGDPAGAAAKISGGSVGDGSYLTFGLNTTGYYVNTVSFAITRSAQGFGQLAASPNQFEYSADGGVTFSSPTSLPLTTASFVTQSVNLSSVAALDNNPLDEFRIIFNGAPSAGSGGPTAGTNTIDNLNVTGAAPEPSEYATLGLVAFGLGAMAFRARKRTVAAV